MQAQDLTLLFGRYRLEDRLGSGGTAEVWRAHLGRDGDPAIGSSQAPSAAPQAESSPTAEEAGEGGGGDAKGKGGGKGRGKGKDG